MSNIATIVLAVKPQVAADVLPAVAAMAGHGTLVLSIMAGKTLAFLQSGLPKAAIVRAMPNTPAAIGRGITVAVPNAGRDRGAEVAGAQHLLAASGSVEWISDEALMDAVTAVSGSGPGLCFPAGGDTDEGRHRRGTSRGAGSEARARDRRRVRRIAASIAARSGNAAQNVTSPGGTTAAALDVLMAADGLDPLMRAAVAGRGKALA